MQISIISTINNITTYGKSKKNDSEYISILP